MIQRLRSQRGQVSGAEKLVLNAGGDCLRTRTPSFSCNEKILFSPSFLTTQMNNGYRTKTTATRPRAQERWPLSPEVLLSYRVLGDTLTWAGFKFTGWKFDIDQGISPLLIKRIQTARLTSKGPLRT